MINTKKGFTLIEILIVVAIIAILASVVLVGLGPTQSLGRDARRVSDLHEIQNGLELYFNKSGAYPTGANAANWTAFAASITGAGIGVSAIPNDPTTGATYIYSTNAGGSTYDLAAKLENGTGGPWTGYVTPGNLAQLSAADTTGGVALTCTTPQYCVTL